MTKTNQASVHEIAFRFWDKQPQQNITDEKISDTLFWMLDAINSGKLEAWHHAKKVNKISGFTANEKNAVVIFVNFPGFFDFLNNSMDAAFKERPVLKGESWKDTKEKLYQHVRGLGDPKEDLILFFQILPVFIKYELLNQHAVHKKEKPTEQKKRPNQIAKAKCRKIAKELWERHKIRSKEMANRPELQEVAGEYIIETRRRWICDLAPPELRKPGAPKKNQSKSSN